MRLESRKLLSDALEAARVLEEFTRARSFEDMGRDKLFRSAIYWQFVVIGEAISQLARIDDATFTQITESPRIVGFRNQIIHGYEVVQDNVTWQIIQDKLPVLTRELEKLLAQ